MVAALAELVQLSPAFTPFASALGGLIIGTASSSHLLMTGHITGLSGLLRGSLLVSPQNPAFSPHAPAFTSGLLLGGVAVNVWPRGAFGKSTVAQHAEGSESLTESLPEGLPESLSESLFDIAAVSPTMAALVGISGVLVGFGTRMANGCTSGHGVCGMPRMSKRSWLAVGIFFPSACVSAITAGCVLGDFSILTGQHLPHASGLVAGVAGVLAAVSLRSRGTYGGVSLAANWASGALMAVGLKISGMTDPHKVVSFLDPVFHAWDPSLACVLGGALGLNFITFRLILKRTRPLLQPKFSLPTKDAITSPLVIGSGIFGMGWGLAGLCPGPAFVGLAAGDPMIWLFCSAHLAGVWFHDRLVRLGLIPN